MCSLSIRVRGPRTSRDSPPSSPGDRMQHWWRLTTTMALPAAAIAGRRSAMAASSSASTTMPSSPTQPRLHVPSPRWTRDPTLAAIGCRILLGSSDADDMSSWGYPSSLLPRAGKSFDTVTFVGAGHAIRRAAWDGYDEALFFCWEEFDFCLRAIERGWRIRYRGDIAVHHKVSPERRVAGPALAGSTSCATGSTSSANGVRGGSACCRASRSICSRVHEMACWADITRRAGGDPSVIPRNHAAPFTGSAQLPPSE